MAPSTLVSVIHHSNMTCLSAVACDICQTDILLIDSHIQVWLGSAEVVSNGDQFACKRMSQTAVHPALPGTSAVLQEVAAGYHPQLMKGVPTMGDYCWLLFVET